MAALTVRINADTHRKLKQMAEQSGESMPKVLDNAIEAYRRQKFLEQANAAYRALKSNAKSWKEERAEREAWNATLADGLEGD